MFRHVSALAANPVSVSGSNLTWVIIVAVVGLLALGVAGVLLSAAGVYLLNISRARISPWAPLVVLFTDRGQRWTLVAALFYAPSVITIKQAALASNAAMGTFGGYLAASLMMTPIALANRSHRELSAVSLLRPLAARL